MVDDENEVKGEGTLGTPSYLFSQKYKYSDPQGTIKNMSKKKEKR
jgi:hypothetical protein